MTRSSRPTDLVSTRAVDGTGGGASHARQLRPVATTAAAPPSSPIATGRAFPRASAL